MINTLEERIDEFLYGKEPDAMEPKLEVMVQSAELRGIFDPLAETQYPFVEIYEDHKHFANTHGYCADRWAQMDEIEISVKPVWNQRFHLRANGSRYYRFVVCLDHHVRMRTICGECGFAASDAWAAAGNAGGPVALSAMIVRRNEITGVLRLVMNLVAPGEPGLPRGLSKPDDYDTYEWNKPDLLKLGDRSALFDARAIGAEHRARAHQEEIFPPTVKAPDFPVHRSPAPEPPQQRTWMPTPALPQPAPTPPQTWGPPPSQSNPQPPPVTMPAQPPPMTVPMSPPLLYSAPAPSPTAFKSEPIMTAQHVAPMPTQYMSTPSPPVQCHVAMPVPSMLEATVPATQAPTAPSSRNEDVPVRLRIDGINLSRLSSEARRQLESGVVARLAKMLGIPTADVRDTLGRPASITLRAGSVIAEGAIRGLDFGNVRTTLKSDLSMMELVTAALSVPGVRSATTGTVEATAEVFDPAGPPPFERPPVSQRQRATTEVEVAPQWLPPSSRPMAPPSTAIQSLPARPTAESMVAMPDMESMVAAPAPLAWSSAPAVRAYHDIAPPVQAMETFLADNSQLRADTAGLGFRQSKNYSDKAVSPTGQPECLEWGKVIQGVDEGDGWVRVAPSRFLPMMLSGKSVLQIKR